MSCCGSNIGYFTKWKQAFGEPAMVAATILASGVLAPIVAILAKKGIEYIIKKSRDKK